MPICGGKGISFNLAPTVKTSILREAGVTPSKCAIVPSANEESDTCITTYIYVLMWSCICVH